MPANDERLFTPRFFLMCGFTFTVFLSAFQLLPTAPFRILSLGGSELVAGLFLGFLTYASAFSAPFTGSLADRLGKRRILIVSSVAIAAFSAAYAFIASVPLMLSLVAAHGIFWSGLLTASGAYLADIIPAHRRGEGIGYYGLSTLLAIATAPSIGLYLYQFGWDVVCFSAAALNVAMAVIASRLPESPHGHAPEGALFGAHLLEWRVAALSFTLFLYSFGYGGVTSFVALYASGNRVTPGLYFTVFAVTTMCTRPISGPLGDRIGHVRVLIPCLALIAVGYALLAVSGTRPWMIASAVVFGLGFGSAYPVYTAYVLQHVDTRRRGAAFGGILAAFDTGIGTGSIIMGWLIHRVGFNAAYAAAACLAAFSIPYFLFSGRRLLWTTSISEGPA
ncbi:MAG: MFS transporter [Vicinamibacterales bacterium]